MKVIMNEFFYFYNFLKLWKSLLYGDVGFYHGKPDGSVFLTPLEALKIAWMVWMR